MKTSSILLRKDNTEKEDEEEDVLGVMLPSRADRHCLLISNQRTFPNHYCDHLVRKCGSKSINQLIE